MPGPVGVVGLGTLGPMLLPPGAVTVPPAGAGGGGGINLVAGATCGTGVKGLPANIFVMSAAVNPVLICCMPHGVSGAFCTLALYFAASNAVPV